MPFPSPSSHRDRRDPPLISSSERAPGSRELEELCREYNSIWLNALYEGLENCSPEEFDEEKDSVLKQVGGAVLVLKNAMETADSSRPAPQEFLDAVTRLTLFVNRVAAARPR